MPGGSGPKRKGNRCEREAVSRAKELGLEAKRAWGSDGRSLGEHEEVDIIVDGAKIQVKARRKLPAYLSLEHVDAVVLKQDFSQRLVLIPFDDWLLLRKGRHECRQQCCEKETGSGSES